MADVVEQKYQNWIDLWFSRWIDVKPDLKEAYCAGYNHAIADRQAVEKPSTPSAPTDNKTVSECKHESDTDGGPCIHCRKASHEWL